MGTRSLTVVHQGKEELLNLYRQMDGYPSGHGKELARFLLSASELCPLRVCNGIGIASQPQPGSLEAFNGAGCLAAQLVAHFKKGIGGFYIHKPRQRDCGEDYVYTVQCPPFAEPGAPTVKIRDVHAKRVVFTGGAVELLAFCRGAA
jgi:hypothetical protein